MERDRWEGRGGARLARYMPSGFARSEGPEPLPQLAHPRIPEAQSANLCPFQTMRTGSPPPLMRLGIRVLYFRDELFFSLALLKRSEAEGAASLSASWVQGGSKTGEGPSL